jgi:hypothetical protein
MDQRLAVIKKYAKYGTRLDSTAAARFADSDGKTPDGSF